MKCLTLVLHESSKQDLIDLFQQIPEVNAYTFIRGEGHTDDTGKNPFESNYDRVVGYVPRSRVDIILADEEIETVLKAINESESCAQGLGVWWVSPVEQWGSL